MVFIPDEHRTHFYPNPQFIPPKGCIAREQYDEQEARVIKLSAAYQKRVEKALRQQEEREAAERKRVAEQEAEEFRKKMMLESLGSSGDAYLISEVPKETS